MKYLYLLLSLTGLCSPPVFGQSTDLPLHTRTIAENLFIPWEIIYAPDDHLWFTQKNGYICRLNVDNGQTDTLYHQPLTVIRGEGGMLGMAIHPEFPEKPHVFVAYEYLTGDDYRERIVRLTYDGNQLLDETTLLDDITGSNNHNGARLLIVDNYLFITTGDAENLSTPQNINSLNGKILRIHLDGSIPADNPIAGNPVWSWGHRNAQGLVFANNKLYSSEHGPADNDEINIIEKGRNYGWPNVRGYCDEPGEIDFCKDSNVVEPIAAWTPTIAPCGLAFYNHDQLPELKNSLLMTTLKDENLYQITLNEAGDEILNIQTILDLNIGRIRDICIAPDGRIFLSTSNSPSNGSEQIDKIIELADTSHNGVKESDPGTSTPIVFPNPATDVLYFNSDIRTGTPYRIYSIDGRMLQSGKVKNNSIRINRLTKGSYFLLFSNGQTFPVIISE